MDLADTRETANAMEAVDASIARANADAEHDRTLVAAIVRGDHDALESLYDRHASQMLGVARRVLAGQGDAEDLLHDVFLEAWSKASSYDATRGSVRSWLLMRVRSRAIDRLRALRTARNHARSEARAAPPPQPASLDPARAADGTRARAALSLLSPDQRSVVELAYFEGLTFREIAERCGSPIGTVKSRMSAAMTRLRDGLAAGAPDAPGGGMG